VPNVAGEVIDVPVEPNTPLKAGDVLPAAKRLPGCIVSQDLVSQDLLLRPARQGGRFGAKFARDSQGSLPEIAFLDYLYEKAVKF